MTYRFGSFELDEGLYELRRAGEPVKLEPKVFDVLLYLVRNRDRVVSKDELLDRLWAGEAVSESVLPTNVAAVRRALRDDPGGRSAIQTVHGRGYRFVAPVEPSGAPAQRPVAPESEPAVGLPFVGREAVMRTLHQALADAQAGRGRLLLLVGEPGIGKTRTAEELARHAREAGVRVLTGRCHEGEGAPAFWPWLQVLRQALGERERETLLHDLGPGASELAELLPELRDLLPGAEAPPDAAPEQARFRLFEAVTELLARLARQRPLLVLLDDLHWGDPATLLLLVFLARETADAPLLVVGSYRDVELRRTHPLARVLGDLARLAHCERIPLRGLSREAVEGFLASQLEEATPEFVDAAYEMTEGNPFFLGEVVRLWESEGLRPRRAGDGRIALPEGVREAIGRRLDSLSEDCNRALRIASVLGREFRTTVLERVADRPAALLLADLDEAVAARIVGPVAGAVGTYAFSHLLVQETLYEELTTPERVGLHRRVAEVLEEARGGESTERLAELAHHLFQAAPGGGVEKAVETCVRAGRQAMRVFAYEEAALHYERALLALDLAAGVDESEGCELILARADALDRAGEFQQSRGAAKRALEKARALGRADLLARAALTLSGRFDLGPPWDLAREELEEALEAVGDGEPALRARLLARLAVTSPYRESMEKRWELSQQALAAARELDDPDVMLAALAAMGYPALLGPDDDEKRLEIAGVVEDLARRTGRRDMLPRVYEDRMRSHLGMGDIEAAARDVETGLRIAESLRDPSLSYFCSFFGVARAIAEGRFAEAERAIWDGHEQGMRFVGQQERNAISVHGIFLYQVMSLLRHKGELDRLPSEIDLFTRYVERFSFPGPILECLRDLCHLRTGQVEEARQGFEATARQPFASIPRDEWWLPTFGVLTELVHAFGDAERARQLHGLLLPFADRNVVHLLRIYDGSASRYLGLLAETFGDLDAAVGHFDAALEMNARMGARAHLAWTRLDAARVRLARAETGDAPAAAGLLEGCRALAAECGMERVTVEADRLQG